MSERHEKWQRVEPGTVIPAGQPYRVEYDDSSAYEINLPASPNGVRTANVGGTAHWFIDSSWKPPLVLPTEPTWGIAVWRAKWCGQRLTAVVGQWRRDDRYGVLRSESHQTEARTVLDFIPLTDEQVARIEQAR